MFMVLQKQNIETLHMMLVVNGEWYWENLPVWVILGVTIKGLADTRKQRLESGNVKACLPRTQRKKRQEEEKNNNFTLSLVGVAIHSFFSRVVNKQLLP